MLSPTGRLNSDASSALRLLGRQLLVVALAMLGAIALIPVPASVYFPVDDASWEYAARPLALSEPLLSTTA